MGRVGPSSNPLHNPFFNCNKYTIPSISFCESAVTRKETISLPLSTIWFCSDARYSSPPPRIHCNCSCRTDKSQSHWSRLHSLQCQGIPSGLISRLYQEAWCVRSVQVTADNRVASKFFFIFSGNFRKIRIHVNRCFNLWSYVHW